MLSVSSCRHSTIIWEDSLSTKTIRKDGLNSTRSTWDPSCAQGQWISKTARHTCLMGHFSVRFRICDVSRSKKSERLVLFARREPGENLTRVSTVQFGDLAQKVVVGSYVPLSITTMVEAHVGVHCRD